MEELTNVLEMHVLNRARPEAEAQPALVATPLVAHAEPLDDGEPQATIVTLTDFLTSQETPRLPPPREPWRRVMLSMFGGLSQWLWGVHVNGLNHVPEQGPFILCPNHESHFDGLWIAACLPPQVRYDLCVIAKREHFEHRFNRVIASLIGAIPIDREGNIEPAFEAGQRVLQEGRPLLMHPEDTRTRDGNPLPFRRGAARLALVTGSPLIPVRIQGAFHIFPAHRAWPHIVSRERLSGPRLRVEFGAPIRPSMQEADQGAEARLTEALSQAVSQLGIEDG